MPQFIPTPLFQIATAHKHMLSIQRDEKGVHVLYVYYVGSPIAYNEIFNSKTTVGIESYKCTDDYYNLLNMVYDYDMFLVKEHSDNERLFNILKPTIDAFNTKYDGSFKQQSFATRIRTDLSLADTKKRTIEISPLMPYNPLNINKDDIKNCIEIANCEPVFATNIISKDNKHYVYQFRLISPVTFSCKTIFLLDPYICIALFKKPEDADIYHKKAVKNSLTFRKNPKYKQLEEQHALAIQTFESYFSQQPKQM